MEFTDGLVVIRGANEASKSTRFQAIAYAMFGARALPLPVAETVTYGQPESAMAVHLEFEFEGTLCVIDRAARGAKLAYGSATANGQAEVTRYVERLLGVSADTATQIMIAPQNGLRGALESNDAVALIEKLANLDLIDMLVKEIQTRLPCGNTSLLETSLGNYAGLSAPVLDAADVDATVVLAQGAVDDLAARKCLLESQQDAEAVEAASKAVRAFNAASVRLETLQAQLPQLEAKLADQPAAPVAGEVERLEAELAREKAETILRKQYRKFLAVQQPDVTSSEDSVGSLRKKLEVHIEDLQKSRTALSLAQAAVIKETSCGLCGKDLQNVPEVVAKNEVFKCRAVAAKDAMAASTLVITDLKERLARAEAYATAEARLKLEQAGLPGVTEVRYDPLRLQWTGPEDLVMPNTTEQLAGAKQVVRGYEAAIAARDVSVAQLASVRQQIAEVHLDCQGAASARKVLEDAEALSNSLAVVAGSLTSATHKLKEAEWNRTATLRKHDAAVITYKVAIATKAELEQQLATMAKHNTLIKKLRTVRPQVAAELWSIVLASVSTHFSTIRGTQSVVTRSADSFLVDGRPAKGLSGSTLDSLGLAIRVALGKTFLPSVQFLLLDEPASGMDEDRELAMLGMLAGLGYAQVVVVTHSNLADTFASSVIDL
jgi:DNA repair exonuclease SbcCD ATPase subunit